MSDYWFTALLLVAKRNVLLSGGLDIAEASALKVKPDHKDTAQSLADAVADRGDDAFQPMQDGRAH